MLKPLYRMRGELWWINYAATVRRESLVFDETWVQFKEACRMRNEDTLFLLMDRCKEAGSVTIVFAALTLEAMIHDFGAHYLGDQYVIDHLDRLDPPSKWVVFTRLVAGQDFPKDDAAFELLQATFRARNELVHAKSVGFHKEGEKYEFKKSEKLTNDFYQKFPVKVAKARRAIDEVPLKLYEITKNSALLLHFPIEQQREIWAKFAKASRGP